MTKREELEKRDSTWNRTADDEPVFILCGRDRFTFDVVDRWISKARLAEVDPRKIESAERFLTRLQEWQGLNPERVKTPDYTPGE